MPTPSPRLETWARRLRWLAPAALLALVPKCGLCLLAYLGVASALGLGGRELCGGPAGPSLSWGWWLLLPAALTVIVLPRLARRRRGGRSTRQASP